MFSDVGNICHNGEASGKAEVMNVRMMLLGPLYQTVLLTCQTWPCLLGTVLLCPKQHILAVLQGLSLKAVAEIASIEPSSMMPLQKGASKDAANG